MRKIFTVLVAIGAIAIGTGFVAPASGAVLTPGKPSIVIVDTGLDVNNKFVADHVVHEVCIMAFSLCPNGQRFMEGMGAAVVPEIAISGNNFYHGTQMASIVLSEVPDAQIIMVRIVTNTSKGLRASVNPILLGQALDWVNSNSEDFNIAAVNISMGYVQRGNTCTSDTNFTQALDALVAKNIPVFAAAGNNYSYSGINWPACVQDVVAVGSLDYISKTYHPSLYSNFGPGLDYSVLGKLKAINAQGKWETVVGTSGATASLVAKYLNLKSSSQISSRAEAISVLNSQVFPAYAPARQGRFKVNAINLATVK